MHDFRQRPIVAFPSVTAVGPERIVGTEFHNLQNAQLD